MGYKLGGTMTNINRRNFQIAAMAIGSGLSLHGKSAQAQTEGGRDGLGDRVLYGAKESLLGKDALTMNGTINRKTREIYLVGSLTDRDNFNTVIVVSILNAQPGRWKVTKIEHNGQSKPWAMWALQLGFATRFDEKAVPTSNLFTRFTFVKSRNCLVFDKGVIQPSQTLVKTWTMIHTEGPIHVLHYERTGDMRAPMTTEQIQKGWGSKAIDQVMNITLQDVTS